MMRLFSIALLLGAAAALIFAALTEPAGMLRAWLTAWLVLIAPAIGAVFLALIAVLAPGPWVDKIWGPARWLLLALPALSLGVVPILLAPGAIYPWVDPGPEAARWVDPRGLWHEPLWFSLRQGLYLAILSGAALLLAAGRVSSRPLAGALAIPVTLAASYFAFDISMSLDPAFNSTIFGLYVIAGQGAAAMGLVIGVRVHLTQDADSVAGRPIWMLFGACALWGYHAFFQYLIIWTGDLPRYAEWFLARNQGAWLIVIFIYAMFFARASLLLLRPVRKSVRGLMTAPLGVVLGVALETVWRTAPDLSPSPAYWAALAGWLALAFGLFALIVAPKRMREAVHVG
ncbi:MAG: hypothetical protein RKE49_03150 [Oceanicaulis sp.]